MDMKQIVELFGPDAEMVGSEVLRRTDRSEVSRVHLASANVESVIVKTFPDAGEGWVRESAALAANRDGAPMPVLLASSTEPALVVMSDAGVGGSLADALRGDDSVEAAAALEMYASGLAELHIRTQRAADRFAGEIARRSAGAVSVSAVPQFVAHARRTLTEVSGHFGVPIPAGALDALADLPQRMSAGQPSALTLADACPDNNVRDGDRYVFIDFERAEWRPIAWDVAYLTVPWPSCWCSFRLPGDIVENAVSRYRKVAAQHLPYVASNDFDRDLALARLAWAFISVSWFVDAAITDDQPLNTRVPGLPTRRAVILHRLGYASRDGDLSPVLAEFAGRLSRALTERWGSRPLRPAPAFR
jgi:hypothetical protein